ncbi:MAG: chloride channel protein [Dissulfurimicrobium sp.]
MNRHRYLYNIFNLQRLLERWQPSESMVLGGVALFTGLGSGVGVWLFKCLIGLAHLFFFERLGYFLNFLGPWRVLPLPVLGGFAVGLLVYLVGGQKRLQGVSGLIEAVAIAGGRLPYMFAPVKAVASALSIGSGGSVGPEDPSVQIGASFGSMLGQKLRLSDERIKILVAAGAAGGISAAFNAPIAGVFFSMEIVLGEISGGALGIVILSSVISAIFTQWASGPEPAFHVFHRSISAFKDLPLYLGLGLVSGPISAIYTRLLYIFKDMFSAWRFPGWLKPAIAGVFLGIIGVFLPQVLGVGYRTIEGVLGGQHLGLLLLFAILAAKLIVTPMSIASGFQGGLFAPALFIGAILGAAYGSVADSLFPTLFIDPSSFAMIGMAALLAGAVHAPLTAILLIFEMTKDYTVMPPLMLAVAVSFFVSRRLQRDSIYFYAFARRGIRIEHGRDVEVLEGLTVSQIMKREIEVLHESDSLAAASNTFMRLRTHSLPVVDSDGWLVGIFTMQDLDRAYGEGKKNVGEACTRELLVTYPEETSAEALRKMGIRDIGMLPVVEKGNRRRIIGLLQRDDIIRAYNVALTLRAEGRHHMQQIRLGAVSGATVREFVVRPGSSCAGKKISEVAWPGDALVVSIRRGHRLIIPHGETVLQGDDVIVVVTKDSWTDEPQGQVDMSMPCR